MCFYKKLESSIKKFKRQKMGPSSPSIDENKYILEKEIFLEGKLDITKSSLYKRRYNKNVKKSN
jgi:hypothetical protein